MDSIKMIDLFAGIGGIRLGFEQASQELNIPLETVFTSEIDKHAQESYRANYGPENLYGDITQVKIENIPKHDILCAGFPCQPFSQAGQQKGFMDVRGTLFFNIAKIIQYHRPRIVFLENVKRFKNHDQGKTFQTVYNILNSLGYTVYDTILNSKDFGLPQNRERIFIVALLNYNSIFSFPEPISIETKLSNILEKKDNSAFTITDNLWKYLQNRKIEQKAKGNGFGFSLFSPEDSYVNTISARYYKDGSEILIKQDGKNPRMLSPREALALQGFPDSFKIVVSKMQIYKQVGNSVSVPVIKNIAISLLKLKKKDFSLNENHPFIDLEKIQIETIKELDHDKKRIISKRKHTEQQYAVSLFEDIE